MSDNEILGGLRNALENGTSLERAVQSFISAGYNVKLVQEAANELSSGVTNITNPQPIKNSTPQFPIYNPNNTNLIQPKKEGKELEGKPKKIVIVLIAIFAILIAILIILLVFKEKILTSLS